jgi:hypothetical protein
VGCEETGKLLFTALGAFRLQSLNIEPPI